MEKILENIKILIENAKKERELTECERIILHILAENKYFYPKIKNN